MDARGTATRDGVATSLGAPRGGGFGSATPIGRPRATPMPAPRGAGDVFADVPPGVHDQSFSQLAPLLGAHALPTGQTINVAMNAPNPNLTFREWAARGAVGGLGRAATWPFRFVAGVVEAMAMAMVGVLKWALILLLFPTTLWLGGQLLDRMKHQGSVEAGAATMTHDARHLVAGVRRGVSDDMRDDDAVGAAAKRADERARRDDRRPGADRDDG